MLAALKTGRAYIPVDITFPQERLQKISSITAAEVVFDFSTTKPFIEGVTIVDGEQVDTIASMFRGEDVPESGWVSDEDICYILFTSGSTGDPKGVQISKRNILSFVNWFSGTCKLESGSIVLNQVSYSFDVSVIQLYIYLAQGATLFSIDKGMQDDIGLLFRFLQNSDIASWVSTPAFLEICLSDDSFDCGLLPKMEKFILAGEVLTKKTVSLIWDRFPNAKVINGYGPTEGTVLLSACEITPTMVSDEKSIPIGTMLPGARHWIAGSDGKPLPEGEKGELLVVSESISTGYFKNPSATSKAFFADGEGRGYRTGDLVFEQDGLLYYCGRVDFQVKLNGYRIELEDISETLNYLSCIAGSIVLPVFRDERVAYLVAFVVLREDIGLSGARVSSYLKKELRALIPTYMVPRKIVVLDSFPLNTNGKIDRKKLSEEYL